MEASIELLKEFSSTYLEISTPWMRELFNDKQLAQVKAAFESMVGLDDRKERRAVKDILANQLAGIVDQDGDLVADNVAGIVLDMSRTFRNLFVDQGTTTNYIFFWINSTIKKN